MFAGSFDLAATEALCAGGPLTREDILPTLIGLVDKSVVLRTDEDAARYWLLDTIREFGAERLARLPADADATQDQHIAYFRAMTAARHLQAHGRRAPRAHLRQAGHLLARPARHRAQSDGAVPRAAAASARAAWALTRRPIHQNSTPTTMKHSTGTSSVHR